MIVTLCVPQKLVVPQTRVCCAVRGAAALAPLRAQRAARGGAGGSTGCRSNYYGRPRWSDRAVRPTGQLVQWRVWRSSIGDSCGARLCVGVGSSAVLMANTRGLDSGLEPFAAPSRAADGLPWVA